MIPAPLALLLALAPSPPPSASPRAADVHEREDELVRTCIEHIRQERYENAFGCAETLRQQFLRSPSASDS